MIGSAIWYLGLTHIGRSFAFVTPDWFGFKHSHTITNQVKLSIRLVQLAKYSHYLCVHRLGLENIPSLSSYYLK